jgi:hypothetical protein
MASASSFRILGGQIEAASSRDPWDVAKSRFLENLDEDERRLFNEATAENLFYKTSNLQKRDQDESKTRAAFQSMQPLMSAIEDYGKAMDAYSNIASL